MSNTKMFFSRTALIIVGAVIAISGSYLYASHIPDNKVAGNTLTSADWNAMATEVNTLHDAITITSNKVSIGTRGMQVGSFSTKPTCNSLFSGTIVFDTSNNKPYVCASGGTWKPLE